MITVDVRARRQGGPVSSLTIGADRFRPDRLVDRGTPRRTLAALKTCKTITANNDNAVAGRMGFAPVRLAA